jgi:hypothetical protein
MLKHKRKFILGLVGIVAIMIVAIFDKATSPVCYSIAGIATGVGIANAIKGKNDSL